MKLEFQFYDLGSASSRIKEVISKRRYEELFELILVNIKEDSENKLNRSSLDTWWVAEDKDFNDNVLQIFSNPAYKNLLVNLNFVDNDEIRRLNNMSRWIDKETDCLSFPYIEVGPNFNWTKDNESQDFWDIFIACDYITAQAKEHSVELEYEVIKMFVHSTLHLFWYDHINDEDYKIMNELENIIMTKIFDD